jgi:hypothetical protein
VVVFHAPPGSPVAFPRQARSTFYARDARAGTRHVALAPRGISAGSGNSRRVTERFPPDAPRDTPRDTPPDAPVPRHAARRSHPPHDDACRRSCTRTTTRLPTRRATRRRRSHSPHDDAAGTPAPAPRRLCRRRRFCACRSEGDQHGSVCRTPPTARLKARVNGAAGSRAPPWLYVARLGRRETDRVSDCANGRDGADIHPTGASRTSRARPADYTARTFTPPQPAGPSRATSRLNGAGVHPAGASWTSRARSSLVSW